MSLAAKWTLGMLVVGLLPMLALGFAVLRIQRESLGRVEKELEVAVVDEASAKVGDLLESAADLTGRAAAVLADDTAEVDARMKAVRAEVARNPQITSLAFFDRERTFVDAVVAGDSNEKASLPSAEGFDLAFEAGAAERPTIRFARVLEGGPGGFVVASLGREALDARLRELSTARFGAPDRLYLVDDAGRRLAGGAPRSGRPPILDRAALPPAAFSSPLLVTTEFVDAGVDKVGTVRTMPAQRWAVVVERPTAEAFAALAASRRTFLGTLVVFLVLTAAAGLFLARRALRPVARLATLVERYARRDFKARSDVRSRDELEALGTSLERMADELSASEVELERRAKVQADLSRFLPSEVARSVADGKANLALGGARKRITVVFADVVAFTSFAERATPEKAVAFLNELFTILSEIVFRHDGMVDKFIGDCIMAVFVEAEPSGETDHVERALLAAEDMHRFVESNLPRWRTAYDFEVKLGIGVATGEALIGNLGSESRMEYTAIGDVVNVAARLEGLANPGQTLATAEVASACPDFAFGSLGSHALRGRASAVEIFEVMP